MNVIISIIVNIALILGIITGAGTIGVKSNLKFIRDEVKQVEYENQLIPTVDEDGTYKFTTDRDFRILHLTDIHIGAGSFSTSKDLKALNAVAAMVTEEKPDLVVATGDVVYPVPLQAGTKDNEKSARMFAELMEKLGVYWCLVYGNHDTDEHAMLNRDEASDLYMDKEKYPHCLLQKGPEDIDGVGNYIINIENSRGEITQSLVMVDSNAYVERHLWGMIGKYDCVHKNQVEWYENQIVALTEKNGGKTPKSMVFMHIPVTEMLDAYTEYKENGFKDTENVQYLGGKIGEKKGAVSCSPNNFGFFDAIHRSGSTQAVFCGHDHMNNAGFRYKGIDLFYGMSVDYLAYPGIYRYGAQRGCNVLTINRDGSYEYKHESYYQDKYVPIRPKEKVTFDDMYEVEMP